VLIESLTSRGLIENFARTPNDSIASLQNALELAADNNDRHLRLCLFHNLSRVYVESERYESANECIAMAKNLAGQCNNQLSRYLLLGIEGKKAAATGDLTSAEACFIAARKGLVEMNNTDDAACASLELAILYSKQGRHIEVLDMAVEVIKLLEPLGVHEDVSIALGLLNDAIKETTVPLVILEQSKKIIESHLEDPTRILCNI